MSYIMHGSKHACMHAHAQKTASSQPTHCHLAGLKTIQLLPAELTLLSPQMQDSDRGQGH